MTTLAKTDLAGVLAHLSAEDARYHAWQFGQTWLDEHGPNLALDAFGYAVDERHKLGIEAASVQEVYDAAKLVFAAQPGKNFTFDLSSAVSLCGSPWEQRVVTPEQWVICFARRYLETSEACIDDGFDAEDLVALGAKIMLDLAAAGVPRAAIKSNMDLLCYGNQIAVRLLCDCSPFPQAA
ncbi:hypothetical protein [Cupriavidus metallidurans]|uniref:hypothetical protein n=1 Tax=Cupriavidus metallidurans TaxID=119219 RepID=UPI001CCC83C0|nr:hypothetical protein [Cupriavidus metallidurans]UBM12791.1 hypothetical protein LAI70_27955 [Cupriavidus metallidurans]